MLDKRVVVKLEPYHSNRNILPPEIVPLKDAFGERVKDAVPLGPYTASRIGGPARALLEVRSAIELEQAVTVLWGSGCPFLILGGGSNVLVSDKGVLGVVLLNRARNVQFDMQTEPPTVWAESGANFGVVARQAASRGLSSLEWAAGIPGTIGGAVIGNAGAHGGDMAGNLLVADILQHDRGKEEWPVERLEFAYRSSLLKRSMQASQGISTLQPQYVVVNALLRLERSTPDQVHTRIEELTAYRRRTQPPGASMGSMFKNPPGDYAGRLIEAAGLKGTRRGEAQISELHANFFVNLGQASASDVYALIRLAQEVVSQQFGIQLELEIEIIGEWDVLNGM